MTEKIEVFDADGALSRAFLLQRGACCGNGCKNCPYGFYPSYAEAGESRSLEKRDNSASSSQQ